MGKADAGDAIVGASLFGLAFMLFLGAFGVPFFDWLTEILLVVAGVLMLRGELGANGKVGWALIILGPALFILPAFLPALTMLVMIVATLGLITLGATKFLGLW